jgi:hypothetical protein
MAGRSKAYAYGDIPHIPAALESPVSPLVVDSFGPRVTGWVKRRLGIVLDGWQQYALARALEHDADMQLLAHLILLSVARQNGKSVIVRSLVGWIMDEGHKWDTFRQWQLMLLAAHDAKQARIPYDFIRRDLLTYADINTWGHTARRQGADRARATQYTGLELNGVRVDVATSQPGSTRGVSPGLVAFDEVLTQTTFNMYEVLSPSQIAILNSIMLMTSTAGYADSIVLRAMFDRLYRQHTGAERHDTTFMGLWWRADDDDVGLDWEQLSKANPSLDGGRLSRKMIESEYLILPRGSWVRERLNRWHDERVDAPFSIAAWGACRVSQPLAPDGVADKYVIACDVVSTWAEGSIIVAALRKDGRVGTEVHRHLLARPDKPLTAPDFTREIAALVTRIGKPKVEAIVYSVSSALAPAFERHSVEASLPYQAIQPGRMLMACADFAEAVTARRIAHDDPFLDSQIASAQRRFIGSDGAWRWTISGVPITGVVAATMGVAIAAKSSKGVQVFL